MPWADTTANVAGEAETGRKYLLIDDFLTLGGTLAGLRSHLLKQGGDVVGVATLGKSRFTVRFSPAEDTLAALRARFPGLEAKWPNFAGQPFEALTEGEAKYLLGFESEAALVERIWGANAARNIREAGLFGEDGWRARRSSNRRRSRPRSS